MRVIRLNLMLLLTLTVLQATPAGAATITGFVLLPNTARADEAPILQPAVGVTVTVQGTKLQDVTDARGAFIIKGVQKGPITLVATSPDLPTTTLDVKVTGKRENDAFIINMRRTPSNVHVSSRVYVAFTEPLPLPANLYAHPTANVPTVGPRAPRTAPPYGLNVYETYAPRFPISNAPNGETVIPAPPDSLLMMDADHPARLDYAAASSRLFWLAFDPTGMRLLASTDQDAINVYDADSCHLAGQIPVNGRVNDLERVNRLVYAAVVGQAADGVMVIDVPRGSTTHLLHTSGLFATATHPWSVTASQDGATVYVGLSTPYGGEIAALDGVTGALQAAVPVDVPPLGLALTPDDAHLLVTNGKTETVDVFDPKSLHNANQIPVGGVPFRIAVSPDGAKAYVTCWKSAAVYVLDLNTNKPIRTVMVGQNPSGIAISADGARVYVANSGSGTVTTISGNGEMVESQTPPQPKARPYGVAIPP